MTNRELARLLAEMVVLLRLEEGSPQAFRVRAYEAAVAAVEDAGRPLAELEEAELVAVKGIGKGIAKTIRELVETGTSPKLDELRAQYPPSLIELTRIPGLGPKTIVLLRDRLGVESVDGLRRAIEREAIRELPGMGAKSEEKLAKAIERLGLHGKDRRTPIATALAVAEEITADLEAVPGVTAVQPCGSLRRFQDSVGDVDIVVAATDPLPVVEEFLTHSLADQVLAEGDTKSAILTRSGLQVDLRVVSPEQFGAAILYFTGSKTHNIELRQLAMDRGWLLNEYALQDAETDQAVASKTEEEIYGALGLAWIPPTIREGVGEVGLAAEDALPALVQPSDLRGDLHFHSDWSGDGRASLEAMLEAAQAAGWEYVAVTDHGENLPINGLSRERMLEQRRLLADWRERFADLRILHGCELNIGEDGRLDYDDEFLAGFDWCVASIHSHFDHPPEVQTQRIVAAMWHPAVRMIGHLSGRKVGRRPGVELDVAAVVDTAEETGCVIEINGAIDRLDATVEVLRACRDREVLFSIDTDAHHPSELVRHRYGVLHAQRGWVERDSVVNTWPRSEFLEWLQSRGS